MAAPAVRGHIRRTLQQLKRLAEHEQQRDRAAARRAARARRGLPEYPLKVTVTASGDLSPDLRFWHSGGDKLVYTTDAGMDRLQASLGDLAHVISLGQDIVSFGPLLDDLGARGIEALMVEGGAQIG